MFTKFTNNVSQFFRIHLGGSYEIAVWTLIITFVGVIITFLRPGCWRVVQKIANKIVSKPKKTPSPIAAPVFRDLKRETDNKSKSVNTSIFLHLRFVECPIDYFHLDEVWKVFAGFYTSSDPFSWWLIVGGAGTGKSRTALEFCKFLEKKRQLWPWWKKQWRVGFVSLEETPLEVWDTWCPEQDSLLVIDYVARKFSDDLSRIPKIFTQLTWRAKKKKLGKKRLRILLIEREYHERNEATQAFKWYEKLDKVNCYQPPFDLNAISNEGLYGIAEQTSKKIWKSPKQLPEKSDFLDKLAKLDKKKRPLFAMLLAGYIAEVDPKLEITPNKVLDHAIEQEFDRSLHPMSVEKGSTLFDALLLSTCTGGKFGDCQPPNDHPLWNSGLGERNNEKKFLFYPIEPDLLGERFVLNSDDIEGISRGGLEKLLQSGWRQAPREVSDFFIRCAQDFTFSDSDKIAELFLSVIQTVKENHESRRAWLSAAVNLTASLQPAVGSKVWQAGTKLANTPEFALLLAKEAVRLIKDQYGTKIEDLPIAQKLYDAMFSLGDTLDVALERAKAAAYLASRYSKGGNLTALQKLLRDVVSPTINSNCIDTEKFPVTHQELYDVMNAVVLTLHDAMKAIARRGGDTSELEIL